VNSRELVGLARGALLWGPLCILCVWAPPLEMARYAVAARTAQIVDYFLPALNLTGNRETLLTAQPVQASRSRFIGQLTVAFVYSSVLVLPLLLLTPETLRLYGRPYEATLTIYALLLGVQWVNGVGRPAVRQAVLAWDTRRIGITLGSGALVVILICAFGVTAYGALAAAAASLAGALIVNARAIFQAISGQDPGKSQSRSPSSHGSR
jgi:hypothetical protein